MGRARFEIGRAEKGLTEKLMFGEGFEGEIHEHIGEKSVSGKGISTRSPPE